MNDNDRELQRLMNAEMDGVATAAESVRLRSILETQPDARSQFERLKGVVAALAHLEMEEPPASIKQDVLRAVRTNAAPVRSPRRWLGALPMLFQPWTTLAAGAALGVLVFALLTGNLMSHPGGDTRNWTGAMLPLRGGDSYRVIGSRHFTLARGSVLAQTLAGQEGLALRLASDAPVGTEMDVTYETGEWDAVSVKQETAGNEVMLGTGRLSVRIRQPGHSQYLLELARRGSAGSPLRITIHSPDGYVQGELDTRALRSGS